MLKSDELPEATLPAGIVIRDGSVALLPPRIVAFIWGGRVREIPTLPFGRWKPTPA